MRELAGITLAILLCAACGSSGDPPDETMVTAHVTRDMAGVAGATVLFQNVDSTLVAMTTTDADGIAAVEMASGGMVTVIDQQPGATTLRTYFAVEVGDDLHFHTTSFDSTTHSYSVKFRQPAAANVSTFEVASRCAKQVISIPQPDPITAQVFHPCFGTSDIVITAYDSNHVALSTLYHAGARLTEGDTLDVTEESFVPATSTALTVSGLPANGGALELLLEHDGVLAGNRLLGVTDGTRDVTLPAFPAPSQIAIVRTSAGTLLDWAPPAASRTIDAAAIPPQIAQPGFDVAANQLRWLELPGAEPELVLGTVSAAVGPDIWSWSFLAPHPAKASDQFFSIVLPALPAGVLPFDASTSEFLQGSIELGRIDGGYAAVRGDGRWFDVQSYVGTDLALLPGYLFQPAAGSSGTASFSSVGVMGPP